MGNKYGRSQLVNLLVSAVFIIAGSYLAMMYIMEFPDAQVHWEGISALLVCLVYYIFT